MAGEGSIHAYEFRDPPLIEYANMLHPYLVDAFCLAPTLFVNVY